LLPSPHVAQQQFRTAQPSHEDQAIDDASLGNNTGLWLFSVGLRLKPEAQQGRYWTVDHQDQGLAAILLLMMPMCLTWAL
jgi:hypothetical protein